MGAAQRKRIENDPPENQFRYSRLDLHLLLLAGTNVNHAPVKDGWYWWDQKYAPEDQGSES
jgi:hypothetical protein